MIRVNCFHTSSFTVLVSDVSNRTPDQVQFAAIFPVSQYAPPPGPARSIARPVITHDFSTSPPQRFPEWMPAVAAWTAEVTEPLWCELPNQGFPDPGRSEKE